MVFESLVSDLLNRFIGDYVENLDKSQLKIGIWGGNVVLENLRVKENALSELDVPFKVKAGQVGKLTLKIPWKNLYTEAVVATLDGLYLLVVPGATIKYDPAKEERDLQEVKQKELQRIEDALQLAARRDSQVGEFVFNLESYVYKDVPRDKGRKHKKHKKPFRRSKKHDQKPEKPQEEKKDTFAEKLVTQVIKNLQIKITSIHIRYEDDVTDPERPLSMGVTLSELSLQTTDENWRACILNEAAKIIYKLGRLECLCAYWNVNSPIFYRGSWEEIVDKLKAGISTKDEELKGYQYIFKPIFASAKMCINPNSEVELKSPKAKLALEVQNIAIEMTKPQYLSMVDLLESIDCMVKNSPYRKFRPDVPVHNHAKQWWLYGINSVLEVHIRRFNQMWSWNNIRKHRQTLKAYKAVYKAKLTQGKAREDTEKQILELEKLLDVFNIILARQQAQMEVVRSGQKLIAKKAAAQKQAGGGGGFFSSFFGRKEGKKKEQEEEDKELESIDAIMTTDEKTKLFTAIGYSESSHNLALPKNYVAVIVNFKLLRTSVTIREEANIPEILKVQMIDLSTTVSQRPGAQAIKVEASLEHWYVTGLQQQGVVPSLIATVGDSSSSLLNVLFEINPEDSNADQLLRVHSQPVEIIYDALTVNSLVEFFKTGKGVDLEVITSATLSKLEEIKEKTATGLSHIIETRKVLDLRIDLKPSYLLVPKSGFYHNTSDLMIVDFGSLQLNSVDQGSHQQASSFSSLEEIMDRAYERFSLELRSVQLLYSKSGEAWKSALRQGSSIQHILQPMDFTLQLAKCMVEKDARMPRFKVSGELPLLHVKISDQKIQGVVELVDSIPLPHTTPPSTPTQKALPLADSRPRVLTLSLDPSALPYSMESDSEEDTSERSLDEEAQRSAFEELTNIQFKFEVKMVLLELTRQAAQEDKVLALNVSQLGAEGRLRTHDVTVTSYLRKVSLDYCEIRDAQNQPLHLISSSDKHGSDLLKVEYIKADVNGPSFQTLFDNTEQMLKVEFSSLDFLLHTKALLSTINYLNAALPQELTASKERDTKRQAERAVAGKTVSRGSKDSGVVSFKLYAMLGAFGVVVCDDRSSIADIQIQGIDASVVVQAKETEVFARLRDIVMLDVDPKTIHKKAVSIVGEEVFSFKMCLYPGATEGDGYSDTSKVDSKVTLRVGCIQIIYLHKFLMSLLTFVDNFQTAKEALSAATAQAAVKAASSVRDFAQKSFRLSINIRLKAPLIIIPQSSTSHNAFVVDLGLITVSNSFSLLPVEGFPLPVVMETMDVKLTQLKLSRTVLRRDAPQPEMELLQPINLELLVKRNLGASWFPKIPGVEVKGVLKSLNIALGQEDLGVLMRILAENIGEGSRMLPSDVRKPFTEDKSEMNVDLKQNLPVESRQADTVGNFSEDIVSILLNFEIMEVMMTLKKPKNGIECPFLVLHAAQLGVQTEVHKFDMEATTYIKTISMKCLEFPDSCGEPLCILSSSAEQDTELLKVKYIKADRNGPKFASSFKNTEQRFDIKFSSLELMLHTEALLSTMDFLSVVMSSSSLPFSEKEIKKSEELRISSTKSTVVSSPSDGDSIDLELDMQLGAFNVLVCDLRSNMADIKIQGLHGSLLMQGTQTHMLARLSDFVIINVDPNSIHKKAISIVDDEVFSLSMSLTPKATEGVGYTDTSKVDGKVKLNVGCIQVVYLHKFFMSLLNFSNNFQTAKEAVSAATAQAAVKAASSVRELAQKSFRFSMDIRLKAPLIIIPQSSTSQNAVEADLGLITVSNSFSLLPEEDYPLPPVIDNMDVKLTQLKLSRIFMDKDITQPSSELLQPVNLVLSVKRNLAATWYQKMAAVEVDGDLKPMKVSLSQDDLSVLLNILMENIGEASSIQPHISPDTAIKQTSLPGRSCIQTVSEDGAEKLPEIQSKETELLETLSFSFNVEALGLVLYNNDPTQPGVHQESLCLGEFKLCQMKAAGKMFNNGNLEVSTILPACTLDDRRSGLERVTSRMLGKRDEESDDAMIDVMYSQSAEERTVVAVFQKLYLCASVEFLMAVAEFFLQATPQVPAVTSEKPSQLSLKQISEPKMQSSSRGVPTQRTKLRAVVVDPEVVFVANLMKADAPALVASFQCDFSLTSKEMTQEMKANVKNLKVLACPFIRNKENKAVTTVLRPCSVLLETKMQANVPLMGSVIVEEVIVKVSPIILNTVLTITAAMSPKPKEETSSQKPDELNMLWAVKNVYSCSYWFLGVETAAEVTESFREIDSSKEGESFKAEIKVVQVTLESGQGHRTIPLLLAESSFSGFARNWSSLLSVSADMTLEVNYFNETYAVWEPLIERVDNGRRRWNLTVEIKNNPVRDKSPVPGDDFTVLPDACTAVNICSKDTMNITLSKCCLNVFQNLAQAFSEGTASTFDYSLKEKAPFTIRNALGIPLIVQHSANLRNADSGSRRKVHELGVDESMDLEYSIFESSARGKLSALQRQESCLFNLSIVPKGYSEISNIPVDRPGRRLYNVRNPMQEDAVSVLLQINASEGNKVITVRSPLQIKNHFSVPFAILKYTRELGGLVNIGIAEPEKESHVTLDSYRCQLFLLPIGLLEGQYRESTTCIAWKEQVHVSSEVCSVLRCPARESSFLPLVVSTLAVPDDLCHIASQGEEDWDPAYVIHLHPTVTARNLLPYSIRYLLEGSAEFHELQEGNTADVLNASITGEIMELVLVKYQGRNWNSHVKISPDMPEFFPVCFTSDTSEKLTVDVCVHVSRVAGRLILSVFSPYWIINKTSRVLQYRAEDIYVKHPSDFRDVILFSFKKKNIFSKNKLQLCVSTSSWSEGFSLDTVGSYGCVRCPDKTMDFLVGVSIQMSSFNLTRIVTMSPFYTLVNKSSFELEVGEVQNGIGNGNVGGKWHYISSTECLPLWPESSTGKLCVRVVGSESASKSFFFNKQDSGTLLRMEQYGGIIVDVNISDHSTVISFTDYYDGAAPALLVNHTPWVTVMFRQSGCEASWELKPGEAQRFAWDDPAGVRKLCWTCHVHSGEVDLIKDECGQFAYDGLAQVHWVSFLDGRQRVLLFTEDLAVVTKARQAEELEQFQQEVNISLQNLGLSLINNNNRNEIAYVGITSSGVVWEMRPKNRWKSFNRKNIGLLEKAYQNHITGKTEPGWVKLETGLEVNFAKTPMLMRHPYSCPIRRNFLAGIHVELKQSPHQRSLRAQLHWLQVDNQLKGAIFPIVFHPVPPPKSIALDSEPKPFIDVSIITRFNEHSQVMQFKYFMVLVQEMAVKIDQGFLGEILALFTPPGDSQADKQKTKLIERDLEALQAQLMESTFTDTSGLSFFEHFHISPIKLHLSLSLGSSGDEPEEGDMVAVQSLNLLLKSIGATLTDVDDLIFKLAYFEVKYQFYRREKLMWAVIKHYTEQFLKQMYVLVLGLDVLGNPFGLIRGLSEGVEAFFYEPFQGAVQGPEEFAEGFVIGVRSLLGHTVGGAAGMVSRITGSVGKGLAAITMDKEYQQKRREEMNRPSKDFGESLAKGGKGLLKGVVGGVTGIVTKPVEGAKKEGAAGFFKGIGKGLVGVVARPTGGIVDMASSTFQGIQRVAESTEEVTKLRPVRLIREDGIIRPYDQQESQGYDLFQRSEIKQLDGEFFREHYVYPGHRKTSIIVTNRRVMCVKEIDLIGHFNKEWECQFEHFQQPPSVDGGDLKIYCKEQNKLKILKDGHVPVRVIHLQQTALAEKLKDAIQNARVAQQQHQMVRQKSQRFLKTQQSIR
ncbi:intermembrane lipid transfer protein VPS13C isoform X2 [Hoplias malabaricus]|uniref:intermembrane lipid transfer protein VPS13C isoform X2 n=1 Tax=Hoplias malabaricus TaxID=27720 RepID=UPI003461BC66